MRYITNFQPKLMYENTYKYQPTYEGFDRFLNFSPDIDVIGRYIRSKNDDMK